MRSRHRFVYPAFEETTARAIEACEAAWEFFGGVFRVIIPDNTKAIKTGAPIRDFMMHPLGESIAYLDRRQPGKPFCKFL